MCYKAPFIKELEKSNENLFRKRNAHFNNKAKIWLEYQITKTKIRWLTVLKFICSISSHVITVVVATLVKLSDAFPQEGKSIFSHISNNMPPQNRISKLCYRPSTQRLTSRWYLNMCCQRNWIEIVLMPSCFSFFSHVWACHHFCCLFLLVAVNVSN